ncbi:MAG: DUF2244 domain-containing protein [Pseudomonadota bacterium]
MINAFSSDTPAMSQWVLRPTRSLSWTQTKWVVVAIGSWCLGIGVGFFIAGWPLILPFSGLEAVLVGLAFYMVSRSGQHREVITLEGSHLVVESGRQSIENRVEFDRYWVQVALNSSRYRGHPSVLVLRESGRECRIAQFLTEDERLEIHGALINALSKNR